MSSFYLLGTTTVTRWFGERRGLALALVLVGFNLAYISGGPLAAWLIERVGWRAAYALLGGVCGLITMLAALTVRLPRADEAAEPRAFATKATARGSAPSATLAEALGDPRQGRARGVRDAGARRHPGRAQSRLALRGRAGPRGRRLPLRCDRLVRHPVRRCADRGAGELGAVRARLVAPARLSAGRQCEPQGRRGLGPQARGEPTKRGDIAMDCCGHEGPGGGDARFDIKKVADGVYAAVAAPAYKVNCNTAIIENDDGVMIVDTHSKPSAARVIVEKLRDITR